MYTILKAVPLPATRKPHQESPQIAPSISTDDSPPQIESKYSVVKGNQLTHLIGRIQDQYFPFSSMKVGDSFTLPTSNLHAHNTQQLYTMANLFARAKPGFRISTRQRPDGSRIVSRTN